MHTAQRIIQKLLAAAALAAGVYIVAQQMGYWSDRMPLEVPEAPWAAYVAGIILILVGLVAILPPLRRTRKVGTISFPGEHGEVLIHLDSVQANLNKVVAKRPEVKRSQVRVIPVDDQRRVRLEAEVLLVKTPTGGTRELAEKLRRFISTTASNMLGIDEVATVDLNVRGIVVDKGAVSAMASDAALDAAAAAPKRAHAEPEIRDEPGVDVARFESKDESPVDMRAHEPRDEPTVDALAMEPHEERQAEGAAEFEPPEPQTLEPLERDEPAPLAGWDETSEPDHAVPADADTPVTEDAVQPASEEDVPPPAEDERTKNPFSL